MIISLFPISLLSAVGCKRAIEFPIFLPVCRLVVNDVAEKKSLCVHFVDCRC